MLPRNKARSPCQSTKTPALEQGSRKALALGPSACSFASLRTGIWPGEEGGGHRGLCGELALSKQHREHGRQPVCLGPSCALRLYGRHRALLLPKSKREKKKLLNERVEKCVHV